MSIERLLFLCQEMSAEKVSQRLYGKSLVVLSPLSEELSCTNLTIVFSMLHLLLRICVLTLKTKIDWKPLKSIKNAEILLISVQS